MGIRQWRDSGSSTESDRQASQSPGADLRARALHRRMVQRKAERSSANAAKIPESGGAPLPGDVQARMAPKLGADLSNVRVHTNDESASAAKDLGARAFTVDHDVHFNSGQFAPGTKEGDRLLAHELTHVVQGQKAGVQRKAEPDAGGEKKGGEDLEVSQPEDSSEKEADSVADGVTDQLHGDEKGGEKPGEKGEEQPIELAPEVRAELEKELGELPEFEVVVAPHKVPKGEVATSEGNRLYLRDAGAAQNAAAIKGEVGKIAEAKGGPKTKGDGESAESTSPSTPDEKPAENRAEKPAEIEAAGEDVARKVSLSPDPSANQAATKGDIDKSELDAAAGRAMLSAFSLFGHACSKVRSTVDKEMEAEAALVGMVVELFAGVAIPAIGSAVSSAFMKEGGDAAADALGKGATTEAKDGADKAVGKEVAKTATKAGRKAWDKDVAEQINGGLEKISGTLKESAVGGLTAGETVSDFLDKVMDKEKAVVDRTSDDLPKHSTEYVLTLREVFESSRCTVEVYEEELMKLVRQFESISGIRKSVDSGAWSDNQFACWVGARQGTLAVVSSQPSMRGLAEGKKYKFVREIEAKDLREAAIQKTIETGFSDEKGRLEVVEPKELENLPEGFAAKPPQKEETKESAGTKAKEEPSSKASDDSGMAAPAEAEAPAAEMGSDSEIDADLAPITAPIVDMQSEKEDEIRLVVARGKPQHIDQYSKITIVDGNLHPIPGVQIAGVEVHDTFTVIHVTNTTMDKLSGRLDDQKSGAKAQFPKVKFEE